MDSIVGKSLADRSNWHPLYNKANIGDCMAMVHRLRYGEEVNIGNVVYVAGSLVTANSVRGFHLPALEGSQILLFGDVEFADESSTNIEEKMTSGNKEVDIRSVVESLQIDSGVVGVEQPAPAMQSSTSLGSSHTLTRATSRTLCSTTACNRLLSSVGIGGPVNPPPSVSTIAAPVLSSERGQNVRAVKFLPHQTITLWHLCA